MTNHLPMYIDNDDLYQAYPWLHAFACHSFVSVTPSSYPAIKGWVIAVDADGTPVGVIEPIFEDWYNEANQAKRSGHPLGVSLPRGENRKD